MYFVVADESAQIDPRQRLIKGVHDIPAGAVEVTRSQWESLIQEPEYSWSLVKGKLIKGGLLPRPAPSREEVEALRLVAYAHPVDGSDRYFAEAQRMQAMGEDGWEAMREKGIERYQQIQQEYPWPDSPIAGASPG